MFKRKEMPTPDASQFIQKQKFSAVQNRAITGGPKLITQLYSPIPRASALNKFLPSIANKNSRPTTFVPINFKTVVMKPQEIKVVKG